MVSLLLNDLETSLKPEPIRHLSSIPILVFSDVAHCSRRVERLVAKMKSKKMLHNLKILEYLNRLSDVLYLLARYEEKKGGAETDTPLLQFIPSIKLLVDNNGQV